MNCFVHKGLLQAIGALSFFLGANLDAAVQSNVKTPAAMPAEPRCSFEAKKFFTVWLTEEDHCLPPSMDVWLLCTKYGDKTRFSCTCMLFPAN